MIPANKESFRHTIKDVREQMGLSQEELAHTLGVSFATINRWENGKTAPSKLAQATIDKFCKKMKSLGKLKMVEGPCERGDAATGTDKGA